MTAREPDTVLAALVEAAARARTQLAEPIGDAGRCEHAENNPVYRALGAAPALTTHWLEMVQIAVRSGPERTTTGP